MIVLIIILGTILLSFFALIYQLYRIEGERDIFMRIPKPETEEQKINRERNKKLKKIL